MFGGSPILSVPPGFFSSPPAESYAPAPRYSAPPVQQPAPPPAWQQSAPDQQPAVEAPTPRAPVYRGKADDEVVTETVTVVEEREPERLSLPAPENLGVGCGCGRCECSPCHCNAQVDWAEVHARLERLGALSFQEQKLAGGGYRVSFLLPTEREDRSQHVQATAQTALQAAGLALDRAEELARRR
jgi:hypothetical protein